MRIGIDLGGTKTEGVLMSADGEIVARRRVPSPDDYEGVLSTVTGVVRELQERAPDATIGICTPGAVSPRTGFLKNSNSVSLNGKPLHSDLEKKIGAPVRTANDANCLAVSEAADGAAAGAEIVFAVIIGTGVGGGIALRGRVHDGRNAVAGEWGHIPLPWMGDDELPGPECYCGRRGCIEKFVSGPGMAADFRRAGGESLSPPEIVRRAAAGDAECAAALDRYEDRLARGLAVVADILDPDIIVLGGGMSNISRLYDNLPRKILPWVFGGDFSTPVRPAKYGDSSGVRGAARLW